MGKKILRVYLAKNDTPYSAAYLAKLPRYRPNGSNTSNLYTLK